MLLLPSWTAANWDNLFSRTRTYPVRASEVVIRRDAPDRSIAFVTTGLFEVGISLDNLPYFKRSTLFIFGGDTGVSYGISNLLEVGAELGLRYQTKPGAESLFADPKLAGVNDTGSRWSLPISAFVKARF